MRLRLEATPIELWAKGTALVEELAKAFSGVNAELADLLEKALPPKEKQLKYPVLQELSDLTTKEYEATLKRMLADIGKVLDKSKTAPTLRKSGKLSKQEEDEEEKLEPGDVDPETGELIPEPEDEEEEEEGEEEEEKSLEKALPQSDPLEHDFTKPIADKDGRAYARVKRVLMNRGFSASDFLEGGQFYGYSVNELIDVVREMRKGA